MFSMTSQLAFCLSLMETLAVLVAAHVFRLVFNNCHHIGCVVGCKHVKNLSETQNEGVEKYTVCLLAESCFLSEGCDCAQ